MRDRLDDAYRSPLYDACKQLKLVAVNILLDHGADPNLGYGENFPLVAVIENHARITTKEFSRVPGEDFSSLNGKQATEYLEARIVAKLIRHHVDINFQIRDRFLKNHRKVLGIHI